MKHCFQAGFALPLVLYGSVASSAPITQKVIYQKRFPNKQKIVISREETAYQSPPPDVLKETLKGDPPGTRLGQPDHVYVYRFVLWPGEKMVWTLKRNDFTQLDELHGSFRVCDAALEGKTLLIVYKESGFVYANVIRPTANGYKPLFWRDTVLQHDGGSEGPTAVSANITGSLKDNTLAVIVTNWGLPSILKEIGGPNLRYVFRDGKWIKDANAKALPSGPNTPAPAK